MGTNLNAPNAWYKIRFGAFLQKYDLRSRVTCRVPIERVFAAPAQDDDDDRHRAEHETTADDDPSDHKSTYERVLGLYIVPVSDDDDVKYLNADVTEQLKELYVKLNDERPTVGDDDADHKRYFEIVQACFPPKIHQVGSNDENLKTKFENRITAVPWFALPFDSVEKTIRIRHNYGIRDGEFALVLLDAATGQLITKYAYDRLLQDKDGVQFPWKSPHVLQILKNIPRYISLPHKIETPTSERPNDIELRPPPTPPLPPSSSISFCNLRPKSIIGLYFSAYWCPPCKAFTSQLIKTYNAVRQRGHEFEVIFVSSDRSADSYEHYTSTMPWLAIPYEDSANRKKLTLLYGIQGIPTLILLKSDGSLITEDGRGEINDDPEGTNFPWFPKSVNILTPRLAGRLQKSPAVVLFIDGEEDGEIELAAAVLTPISEYVQKKLKDQFLLFFVATDTDTTESIRDYLQLEDVSPLLTLIDISLGRFTVMEYGKEITEQTIMHFVHRFYNNELIFLPIER